MSVVQMKETTSLRKTQGQWSIQYGTVQALLQLCVLTEENHNAQKNTLGPVQHCQQTQNYYEIFPWASHSQTNPGRSKQERSAKTQCILLSGEKKGGREKVIEVLSESKSILDIFKRNQAHMPHLECLLVNTMPFKHGDALPPIASSVPF